MLFTGRESEEPGSLLDTSVAAYQLQQLFGIEPIFRRRGQTVARYEDPRKLLFNLAPDQVEACYRALGNRTFRRVLAAVTNSPKPLDFEGVCENSKNFKRETVHQQLIKAANLGMVIRQEGLYRGYRNNGFGTTFEWYIAEVCKRELASIAYWGVRVKDLQGDYDVVLVRDTELGYIECKSGKFSNIDPDEIRNFLIRESLLAPGFSMLLLEQASRKNLSRLANLVLGLQKGYRISLPGWTNYSSSLRAEEYKNFVRIVPRNCFLASLQRSTRTVLMEIYHFLTLVGDRKVPMENDSSKEKFGLLEVREYQP
jgi:hypothetical protein